MSISKELKEQIVLDYQEGEEIKDIAKKLNLNYRQVYSICHHQPRKWGNEETSSKKTLLDIHLQPRQGEDFALSLEERKNLYSSYHLTYVDGIQGEDVVRGYKSRIDRFLKKNSSFQEI